MSIVVEIGAVIKKIFLVNEELTRLSSDVKDMSRDVQNHEVRLAVIENTLSLSHRPSQRTLPGD